MNDDLKFHSQMNIGVWNLFDAAGNCLALSKLQADWISKRHNELIDEAYARGQSDASNLNTQAPNKE